MIKNIAFVLGIMLCIHGMSLFAQENKEPPRLNILELDDIEFPNNRLRFMVFDTAISVDKPLNDTLIVFQQDGTAIRFSGIRAAPLNDGEMHINLMIDSRISWQRRGYLNQLIDSVIVQNLPGQMNFNYWEIADFVVRRQDRPRRSDDQPDLNQLEVVEYDLTSFPTLDSLFNIPLRDHLHPLNILILENCRANAEGLSRYLKQNEEQAGFFGLYIADTENCHNLGIPFDPSQMPDNVLFTRALNDSTFIRDIIISTLQAYKNAFHDLSFEMPPVTSTKQHYEYTLTYIGGVLDATKLIGHDYPLRDIYNAYANHVLLRIDSLMKTGEYRSAHYLLHDAYMEVELPVLRFAAEDLIRNESEALLASEEPRPEGLFSAAEDIWNITTDLEWYHEMKVGLLKHYYYKTGQFAAEEKLPLLSDIYGLDPADQVFRVYYYHTLGDNYLDGGDHEKAVENYLVIYDHQSSTNELKESMLEALRPLFAQKHRDGKHTFIYETGLRTHDLFGRRFFTMNYYFGRSCRYMQDFERAYDAYYFLYSNWIDRQNLITWTDLLMAIEELSMQTGKFDQALYMNIRLQRNQGGREQIHNYLVNARTADYYGMSKLLASFFSRNGIRHNLSAIDEHYPGDKTPAINGIYFLDRASNVIHTAYRLHSLKPPNIRHIGDETEMLLRDHTAGDLRTYLVHRLADEQYLVVELRNTGFEQTEMLLSDIESRNTLNAPWENLRRIEMLHNHKRVAITFANVLEIELQRRNSIALNAYWRAASADFAYLVLHATDGTVLQSHGYDLDEVVFGDGDRERSSVARGYYEQEVTYDGQSLRDIAMPLHSGNEYRGVIRIGFMM